MNYLIKTSTLNILSDKLTLNRIDNIYIFVKYYNILKEHKDIIDNFEQ